MVGLISHVGYLASLAGLVAGWLRRLVALSGFDAAAEFHVAVLESPGRKRDEPISAMAVIDEAYFEYVVQEHYSDSVLWLEEFPNLIITRTFSKAYGLAGLRVGYGLSHPQVAELLNRVRHPFNVNSVGQAAALAALQSRGRGSPSQRPSRQVWPTAQRIHIRPVTLSMTVPSLT